MRGGENGARKRAAIDGNDGIDNDRDNQPVTRGDLARLLDAHHTESTAAVATVESKLNTVLCGTLTKVDDMYQKKFREVDARHNSLEERVAKLESAAPAVEKNFKEVRASLAMAEAAPTAPSALLDMDDFTRSADPTVVRVRAAEGISHPALAASITPETCQSSCSRLRTWTSRPSSTGDLVASCRPRWLAG